MNAMKTFTLLTLASLLALSACSITHATSKSATPNALEPALISKFLRARADMLDKSMALNAPVDAILDEARLDCKVKGFDTDKDGKGIVNLDANGLLACVKAPKPAATPQPAPEAKK